MRVCEVLGCGRKHDARGLCKAHYKRREHGVTPLNIPIGAVVRTQPESCTAPCSPPCERKCMSLGLCNAHWQRQYMGHTLDGPIRVHRVGCDVPECERKHNRRGLCSFHWYREGQGLPLNMPFGGYMVLRWCNDIGCDQPHFGKGLCKKHYDEEYLAEKMAQSYLRRADPAVRERDRDSHRRWLRRQPTVYHEHEYDKIRVRIKLEPGFRENRNAAGKRSWENRSEETREHDQQRRKSWARTPKARKVRKAQKSFRQAIVRAAIM